MSGARLARLQEIIDRRLGDPFFGIGLNPGHLIGLDEWLHSPVSRGSEVRLRRRTFMSSQPGIDLHPDVLRFSNLSAHLAPFLLSPDRAMTVAP